jgi:hypothetical protein
MKRRWTTPVVSRFERACIKLGLPVSLIKNFGGSDNNVIAQHGSPYCVATHEEHPRLRTSLQGEELIAQQI